MEKSPRFELVAPDIYLLKTPFCGAWSGVYLVRRKRNLLIDSGADASVIDRCVIPALAHLEMGVADIGVLLCTHTHGDHIGGHARLEQLLHIPCAVFESAMGKLFEPMKYSKRIRAKFPQFSPPPPPVLEGVTADLFLKDNEMLDDLRLIHTPGHDTDTVCYFDTVTETLLTGDSVQGNGTGQQGCALYMDLPGYRRSLKRLLELDARRMVTGHAYLPWGNPVIEGRENVRKCLHDCLDLLEKYDTLIRRMLDSGLTDPAEMVRQLIDDIGGTRPAFLFLGLYTVTEHLNAIEQCKNS